MKRSRKIATTACAVALALATAGTACGCISASADKTTEDGAGESSVVEKDGREVKVPVSIEEAKDNKAKDSEASEKGSKLEGITSAVEKMKALAKNTDAKLDGTSKEEAFEQAREYDEPGSIQPQVEATQDSTSSQPAQESATSASQSSTLAKHPSQMTPAEHCLMYGHAWKTHQETIPAQYEWMYVEGGWFGIYVIRDYDDFYYTEFSNREEAEAYAVGTGLYVSYVQPHHRNSYKTLASPETTKTVQICNKCGAQK